MSLSVSQYVRVQRAPQQFFSQSAELESVLKHIDLLNVESTSAQTATSTSCQHTDNYELSKTEEVQEMIQAKHDCRTQPSLNIPLIKVVVRVQTQHMPVIQAKRFKLPHPQLRQLTGHNSSEIQQH